MGADYIYGAYFWDCYYAWIKLTNEIISRASALNLEDDAEVRDYLGQAYAYRAWCYLARGRLYEPKENAEVPIPSEILELTVPIVDENITYLHPDEADKLGVITCKNNPRAPRQEIYQFILDDLKRAEENLNPAIPTFSQPTMMMVYGLYARTYLELGYADDPAFPRDEMFANAAEYARKVIDEGGFSCTHRPYHTDINIATGSGSDACIHSFQPPFTTEYVPGT